MTSYYTSNLPLYLKKLLRKFIELAATLPTANLTLKIDDSATLSYEAAKVNNQEREDGCFILECNGQKCSFTERDLRKWTGGFV